MLLQTLGVLMQGAGIAFLFLHWRAKQSRNGWFLAAGWALIALGAAPWFLGVSPERALAIGILAPMVFGLLFLAPDALPRIGADAVRKKSKTAPEPDETETPPSGRAPRNAARWFAALLAAPLLAFAAAAAYQVITPGSIADRTVFSGVALIVIWTAAALWLLATPKPWRDSGAACAGAILIGAAVFMIASHGAA